MPLYCNKHGGVWTGSCWAADFQSTCYRKSGLRMERTVEIIDGIHNNFRNGLKSSHKWQHIDSTTNWLNFFSFNPQCHYLLLRKLLLTWNLDSLLSWEGLLRNCRCQDSPWMYWRNAILQPNCCQGQLKIKVSYMLFRYLQGFHSIYRSDELVNCRLLGGAQPAEQAVQRNQWAAGAGDAPVIPSTGVGAHFSAVCSGGLWRPNTTMVFAWSTGAWTPGKKNRITLTKYWWLTTFWMLRG